ncbi:Hsp70 family protein [Telmatocola sphagniphila]|uniref:Hsp70 family protein n=1 Tax=Telmatocola sphagniphila TaxID=1123043 RepID=A0A8E6B3S7_9BACT|nr:Hsp70 family protein [Telmatocola sphagniphila]QVL31650.1 Hsp70 family protein [Telmatocola sphagniphila]
MASSLPNGMKELPLLGYIGIDFGTSTTHIAVCYLDGNTVPQAVPLAGKSSILTCLLLREANSNGEAVVAYGEKALRTWFTLSDSERKNHRFAVGFKPDIISGSRAGIAQSDSRAFLTKCFQAVRESGVVRALGREEGMPVVIGVPAEISELQKRTTAELAEQAGFGKVNSLEEPLGALAYHLADGSVSGAEARTGVLVIDFGGGTLDIAWLNSSKGMAAPWGDPLLGGRLFDDIFYQWLLQQNPQIELSDADQFFVWQATCRELKEKFSTHWQDELDSSQKPALEAIEYQDLLALPGRRFAEFRGSVPEFLNRTQRYRPSSVAQEYFSKVDSRLRDLGKEKPVDLLDWIRRELTRGFNQNQHPLALIILTGGSCKWPFMRDLAVDAFGLKRECVRRSPDPETTIGSGLAVYNVLKHRNALKRQKLHEEFPTYKEKFQRRVEEKIDEFTRQTAMAVVLPLMKQVESLFLKWYSEGGALKSVQENIQTFVENYDVKNTLQARDKLLAEDLMRLIRDYLGIWLKEHSIHRKVEDLLPPGTLTVPVPELGSFTNEITKIISNLVVIGLTGTIFGIVYLAAHGTHILAHPLTGLPIALASALAAGLGFQRIEEPLRRKVLEFEWGQNSLKALKLALSENRLKEKIAESQQKAIQEIQDLLKGAGPRDQAPTAARPSSSWNNLQELRARVTGQFEDIVNKVIEDLGVLEEIRRD